MTAQSRIRGTIVDSSGVRLAGVRVSLSGAQASTLSDTAGAFIIANDVSQIELVEVYKGISDIPPQMRGNNCGAIAIYTK